MITTHGFFPKVTLPARLSKHSGTLIDNFFCKVPSGSSACINTSGVSDHFPYVLFLEDNDAKVVSDKYIHKTDLSDDAFRKFKFADKSINFSTLIDSQRNADPDKNVEIISNTIVKIKNQLLPTKCKKKNNNNNKSPWITTGILKSICIRDKLYQFYKQSPLGSLEFEARKIHLRTYNCILKRNIFLAEKAYYTDFFNKNKHNMKQTWGGILDILSSKSKSKKTSTRQLLMELRWTIK